MIATYSPQPIVNAFHEVNIGKYKGTKHYDLTEHSPKAITLKARLAVNRSFAKSLPNYWLSFRPANKWVSITGLFRIGSTQYYKGDADHKKHLVIVEVKEQSNTITLYYFENYFTRDYALIQGIIRKLQTSTN
jgi:hypothetical protein